MVVDIHPSDQLHADHCLPDQHHHQQPPRVGQLRLQTAGERENGQPMHQQPSRHHISSNEEESDVRLSSPAHSASSPGYGGSQLNEMTTDDEDAKSGTETAPLVRSGAPFSHATSTAAVMAGTTSALGASGRARSTHSHLTSSDLTSEPESPASKPSVEEPSSPAPAISKSSASKAAKESKTSNEPVTVIGISLARFTTTQQFIICVAGVFGFYGMYAVLQEKIFSFKGFEYGLYLTVVQFSIYTLICKLEMWLHDLATPSTSTSHTLSQSKGSGSASRDREDDLHVLSNSALSPTPTLESLPIVNTINVDAKLVNDPPPGPKPVSVKEHHHHSGPKAPLTAYALIGFISVATVSLSNVACQYLIYPLQVMLKSCKLLPVMIVGTLYFGKKYGRFEYLAILFLSVGVIVCSFGGRSIDVSSLSTDWNLCIGLALMGGALAADAVIGNAQEYVMKKYQSSTSEMILYSKFWGFVYLGTTLLVSGKLVESFVFCWNNPQLYVYMVSFAVCGCLGEHFVMSLIRKWGALIAVVVTSLRKVLTVILSFIIFPKPLKPVFAVGMILVFVGMFLEAYAKNRTAIDAGIKRYRAYISTALFGSALVTECRRQGNALQSDLELK